MISRRISLVLAMTLAALAGGPAAAEANDWARLPVLETEGACPEPAQAWSPGWVVGPWSGRTPPVSVGVLHLLSDPDEPPGRPHGLALMGTDDPGARVLGCVDIPADWDRREPVEVEIQAQVPGLWGKARLEAVDEWITEVVLVTWRGEILTPSGGTETCDVVGPTKTLLTDLADLGLTRRWTLEAPDGTPIRVAWSERGRLTASIVGENPVRSVAAQALYEADKTVRGGWDFDAVSAGMTMLDTLWRRWSPESDDFGPGAWPTTRISSTARLEATAAVELDETGMLFGYRLDPLPVPDPEEDCD